MKKKTYLLDTNVLMKYPGSIYGFDDNDVVITATTVEELDNNKNAPGERGFQAREALRRIDELRILAKQQKGKLSDGVLINNKTGTFRIESNHVTADVLPQGWDISKADNKIISCAKNLHCILVSEDRGICIKADEIGVQVENYRNAEIVEESGYKGYSEIYLKAEYVNKIAKQGYISIAEIETDDTFTENEYLIIHDASNPQKHTVLARYRDGFLKQLVGFEKSCKVSPRDALQEFAIDALMSDDIPLVFLKGPAGSAKSFLSVAAGMQGLTEKWDQIICTRNNIEMDRDIGALPGDEEAKVAPLVRGICDNIRNYLSIQGTAKQDLDSSIDDYLDTQLIKFEAMGYMRGRSITNSYLILDEAQNATPHQIKSIITRAGEGCKVVVCGDPEQIDDIKLDRKNNGLVRASEAMQGSTCAAQITFTEEDIRRSELARAAATRMADF
ncbi:PhoH family protein [Butyrivibrio sp.]|uniref:PhoH family protein n=1 Tax=Butyrivibrio sp. TaxID=28121 RepID=UPI0025BDFF1F|nr:PhoH family protein [Butyrivibrio sp.]MBQ9302335.1 PhoH family protein [Butyrivibrio sp.]